MRFLMKDRQFSEVLVECNDDSIAPTGMAENFQIARVPLPIAHPFHFVTGCQECGFILIGNAGIE